MRFFQKASSKLLGYLLTLRSPRYYAKQMFSGAEKTNLYKLKLKTWLQQRGAVSPETDSKQETNDLSST